MLRINLNLTIVAMVMPRAKVSTSSQCIKNLWSHILYNRTYDSYNKTTPTPPILEQDVNYDDRFPWSENQQGLILGAYYWLHWATQLPGGLLARRYGTKLVYGLGNFLTALFGFLIPLMTHYHLYALVTLRVLQGLFAKESFRRYCFWLLLIHDSPQQHPRISDEEKKYILDHLGDSVDEGQTAIPWKEILTSGPVWITIISQWGGAWGFLTLMTQAPTYFNFIHGWDINATGFLSGSPHLFRMIFSYYYSIMSDWLIRTNKMSLTNVRKIAMFVCTGLQGIFILALGYSGCHSTLVVIFMIAGTTVNGAVSAGPLATFVDLSPNYASILLGFCGMVVIACGFISPAIVGILTHNNQTVSQWRLVFIIAAINTFVGTVVYLVFGTSKEQPWNKYSKSSKDNGQKLEELTAKPIIKIEEGDKDATEKDRMITD
ncbi:unnamed protein product, partial [Heterotrigona itama]